MTEIKRGPCAHGNPCRESMCVEYGRSEAAAGPRDLHCARCDARIELRHYDYPQHVRDHIPVVAAGPEPESPASAWLEGYKRGRIEAEAAADVQQYWTDTGHMPAASPAPEVCPVCKLGWDRHKDVDA